MKNNYKKGYVVPLVIAIVVLVLGGSYVYYKTQSNKAKSNLPTDLTDTTIVATSTSNTEPTTPVITSISQASGPIGTIIELKGTNLAGFEGDLDAIIENSKGETAYLNGIGSVPRTDKTIRVKIDNQICKANNSYSGLPCTSFLTIIPGTYKIYTAPWGKVSNKVGFTVTASSSANSFVGQCPDGQIWTGTKCVSNPTYEEMLNSILQAKILGKNARIKADMMNMRVMAELIYQAKNSYASFCTNGVINLNSYKDISSIIQDIITSQEAIDQNSAGIKCASSQTGYALQTTFTKIPTTGSKWFCLDWLGHQGDDTKFKIDTTALECKPI